MFESLQCSLCGPIQADHPATSQMRPVMNVSGWCSAEFKTDLVPAPCGAGALLGHAHAEALQAAV